MIKVSTLAVANNSARGAPANEAERSAQVFYQALVRGDAATAGQVVQELSVGSHRLVTLFHEVFTPSLVKLGEEWCAGDVSIGQEKLATQIVNEQLDRLRTLYAIEEARPPFRVLVACLAGERHILGARMFADLCLSQGWAVDFLGADVPTSEIVKLASLRKAQLVAISATMDSGADLLHNLVERFALLPDAPNLLIGGQALRGLVFTDPSGFVVAQAADVGEGLRLAGRMLRETHPKAVLKEYLQVLGRRVKHLRSKHGWTQEQLAEATKVTRVCIVAVEGGKQNVSMDIVVRLANALSVTPESLLSSGSDDLRMADTGG